MTRTYNVNGVEKPITPEADDALSAIPANLTDATAETWHALCTSVDERYGVYRLNLAAAIEAGGAALALLDQAAPPTGPSEEDIDGPRDAQAWVLGMAIDNAAAAIEEKGVTLHSVTEPHQPTRTFGYVRTANGSADSQRADIVKTVGAIRIFSDEGVSPQALTAPGCASWWRSCRPATKSSSGSTTGSDGPSRRCGPSLS